MTVAPDDAPTPRAVRGALRAGDGARAERAWRSLIAAEPDAVAAWTCGVEVAGWRGDPTAVADRERGGRAALARSGDAWRERHALALAAGEAHVCLADVRGALPRLGEALGQTEWHPDHPGAVTALLAIAQVHALHAAPRKALEQVARATERAAAHGGERERTRAWRARARWVVAVANVRLVGAPRGAAARRARRLARLARASRDAAVALRLDVEAAVLSDDAAAEERALASADALDLAGVRGRAALLRAALERGRP